jgi:hypothetical protein
MPGVYGGSAVAPSSRRWWGVARENQVGVVTPPTNTVPVDAKSLAPEDQVHFLPDEAIRGSMAMLFNEIIGPEDATFSFGGPNFLDTYGFFLDNIFGDLSTTGTTLANPTSLGGSAATLAIGGTQATIVNATGYASASTVQIDTGNITETVILSAVSGTLITFGNYPLRFPHASGATVSTVSAGPYTHTFALLNSQLGYGGVAGAQPPTLTITDNTNLNYTGSPGTNTSGARAYASACVSAVDITGNAEQLLDFKISGNSFVSAPASAAPTNTISSVIPVANWRGQIYIGGTAASNQVFQIGEWALNIKRQLQVYWTVQGIQNPYIIARGPLSATFSLKYTSPYDESPLAALLYLGYQWVHIVLDNGLSGTSHIRLTIDAHNAQAVKSKPGSSSVLIDFDDSFECVSSSSDSGGSGGLGPLTMTLINAIATY